jgi:hypothetical protein
MKACPHQDEHRDALPAREPAPPARVRAPCRQCGEARFFEIFNLLPFEDIIGKYLPSLIFSFATSTCCNWVIYEPAASRESIRRLSGVFYEIEHPFLVPIKALFGLYPNNDS